MRREATAMTVRQNLGELLDQVEYRGDSIVVTKDGKAVAALVDYPLYERIRQLREGFDALNEKLGRVYAGVSEAELAADVDSAVSAVRAIRRAKRR